MEVYIKFLFHSYDFIHIFIWKCVIIFDDVLMSNNQRWAHFCAIIFWTHLVCMMHLCHDIGLFQQCIVYNRLVLREI